METQGHVEKMTMAPQNLSRVGFIDLMSVAHPLVEPGTHTTFTVVTRVSLVPGIEHELCLLRMTSPVDRQRISCWPVGHKVVYLHSFSLTLTRAVVMVSPLYLKGAACILATAAPFECFEWLPHEPSVLYVITLSTGKVTAVKVTPPSVFSLHHINAYDTSAGTIVMDVVSHQNTDVLQGLMLDVLRDPVRRDSLDVHAMVVRVTIWLDDVRASVTRLDATDEPTVASRLEFPAINELYRSRDYCYVYGIVLKADHVTFSKMLLVKKDLCAGGKRDLHLYIPGIYFLEPSFVANPRAASEDDGVLSQHKAPPPPPHRPPIPISTILPTPNNNVKETQPELSKKLIVCPC
ncbi:uncharacterized protein LOC131935416 [Physella acuta]|uniref:uncharacterized protein LOC131935416 n=1 Tax=Physella acuta TaxID=109671 RepID=UPI0027DC84FB|nr:uncharacterized protein LOC131935416 [Physella acuta]